MDDERDGCDAEIEPLAEGEVDLFVLFAEALDPDSPIEVEDVEETWS